MSVLDAGCGTGSITAGIAAAVGPAGHVIGLDRDESLLAIARQDHTTVANLEFVSGDLLALPSDPRFDISTAARLIQWIGDPGEAVRRLAAATRPGGRVVALDYNHALNSWTPDPPAGFRRFYQAFLDWRASNGWDNMMGERLPALFESAGLRRIEVYIDDEITPRGSAIWLHVLQSMGPKILTDERDRAAIEAAYREYIETRLDVQSLSLRTVIGDKAA
jgi:SAM-dependent methyltransferase